MRQSSPNNQTLIAGSPHPSTQKTTWTPEVCKINALMAAAMGSGLLFYILLGFRYKLEFPTLPRKTRIAKAPTALESSQNLPSYPCAPNPQRMPTLGAYVTYIGICIGARIYKYIGIMEKKMETTRICRGYTWAPTKSTHISTLPTSFGHLASRVHHEPSGVYP